MQTGCYYAHLAAGQTRVLWARRAVDDVIADPETPPELRERLLLVERARDFARELGLEVEGQYTSYVPWPGDRVLTTLIVSEPGRIEARPFRFPIVGSVPYKGFFDEERAQAEAARFAERGLDTCLLPVAAYSTLGFFDDPLTDPLLRRSDGSLVEIVIHELVHATVFLQSEPALNEGAAQFIGEEASIRFFADAPDASFRRRDEVADDRRVGAALSQLRTRIEALYGEPHAPAERARRRAELERAARAELAALPLATRDPARVAERARLGDACLALHGTYEADTPRHAAVLAALDGDLARFVARLRDVAAAQEQDGDADPGGARGAFFAIADEPAAELGRAGP